MLIKIVLVQAQMGRPLQLEEKIFIFRQRPDFVCLPEYWLLDPQVTDFARAALLSHEHTEYLQQLSDELTTCLIGGTVVAATSDHLYNCCYVINRGVVLGSYRKRFPVVGEVKAGISAGDQNLVLEIEGVRVGVMICGDVFYPEMFTQLRDQAVDLIVIPTTSPYRPDDSVSQKEYRDRRYFVEGARTAQAYVAKTCGVGRQGGNPLQGRSLMAAPWGILDRIDFTSEAKRRILAITLDLEEIRDFRRKLISSPPLSIKEKIPAPLLGLY